MLRSPLFRSACFVFGAALTLPFSASNSRAASLNDPEIDRRARALLAGMTVEEKVAQLHQLSSTFDITGPIPADATERERLGQLQRGEVGSMLNVVGAEATRRAQAMNLSGNRLKIPLLFGFDVIHGYRTIFPVPLGEAASWDLAAMELSARVAATEAASAGVHWTFAPMVDLSRDPRWGRVMEGAGEDPWLGSQIAAARVRGFQGSDLANLDSVIACAKHFAAYGFAEGGRDYNTTDLSEQTLRNAVLPPFHAAVKAGAATLMNSFNEIGGIPSTANAHIQRTILKGEWGFNGFVVSDWNSIGELIQHGVARDREEAGLLALRAGNDMDMETSAYHLHLADLVKRGVVSIALVDDAVLRILRVKYALGLFEDPFARCNLERENTTLGAAKHHEAAREVAKKSIVLLRNEGGLLPIAPGVKKIAVIGPLAADKDVPLGSWRGWAVPESAVSLLEGIQAAAPAGTQIVFAEGGKHGLGKREFHRELMLNTYERGGFPAAVQAARDADLVVVAVGEDSMQTGEGRSQVEPALKGVQEDLVREVLAANPRTVVVLMNGRPLVIPWLAENVPAIVEAWFPGSEAGHAIADVLFGKHNPSGKLPMTFPRHVGQIPIYYNSKNTGRPTNAGTAVFWSHYTDAPNDPLYPFGFGLSFTTFAYSAPKLSAAEISPEGTLEVSVTVTNSGALAGTEVVQLYIRDLVASATRPVKELKGFQRIELSPGEAREVRFTLRASDLEFYSARGRWEAEPGEFRVMTGGNSRDVQEATFWLK